MKNTRIVKTLAIAALSSLTQMASASQSYDWGHYERANATYFPDRPNFDRPAIEHRGPDVFQPRESSYSIDARQQKQMDRIMHGLRSGDLSRHEARNLIREQRDIEKMQRYFLADGHLNRYEWLKLDRRLDRAAHDIRAEKRDGDWR
jgi:hypothetical protein